MSENRTISSALGLLYSNPLYDWIEKRDKSISVLVIGNSAFSADFTDVCLQVGQMSDSVLTVSVASPDSEAVRAEYLAKRPGLVEFVSVDSTSCVVAGKEISDPEEIYAYLNFIPFDSGDIGSLFKKGKRYNYIVIDAGTDAENAELARKMDFAMRACGRTGMIAPVTSLTGDSVLIGSELERMAFNVHLTWADVMNRGSLEAEWQNFKKPYNYYSSISNALSIQYKIRSLGIQGGDPEETAEKVNNLLNNSDRSYIDRLSYLEHRRWVLEKVTAGWRSPRKKNGEIDFTGCLTRMSVKNNDEKTHPCIVRSRPESPLSSDSYIMNKYSAWDSYVPGDEKLEELDELDRMTLALHRFMKTNAGQLKGKKPFVLPEGWDAAQDAAGEAEEAQNGQGAVAKAEALVKLGASDRTKEYCARYVFFLKQIYDGSYTYSKQFGGCEADFENAVNTDELIGTERRDRINGLIRLIRKLFFASINFNLYTDYKKYDEDLILNIPFILTNRTDYVLGAVFDEASEINENNNTIIMNAVSALMINPAKLVYCAYFKAESDARLFDRRIRALKRFLLQRQIRCPLKFFFAVENEKSALSREGSLENVILGLEKGGIAECSLRICPDGDDLLEFYRTVIKEEKVSIFDASSDPFSTRNGYRRFVEMLDETVPHFEYDSVRRSFVECKNCRQLTYIRNSAYLRIDEMFSLMDAKPAAQSRVNMALDYDDFWSIYTGDYGRPEQPLTAEVMSRNVTAWNIMCDIIAEYFRNAEREGAPGDLLEVRDLMRYDRRPEFREKTLLNVGRILDKLERKKYIHSVDRSDNTFSFVIADRDTKEILSKAGEFLERYTYFKCFEEDFFDEIAAGYEFDWNIPDGTRESKNELDCILTRGFRSVIAECKAQVKLDQNFYHKLYNLSWQFGVSCRPVLIAITNPKDDDNRMQMERGREMGIITVSEPDDIKNIGRTLREIMETGRR